MAKDNETLLSEYIIIVVHDAADSSKKREG